MQVHEHSARRLPYLVEDEGKEQHHLFKAIKLKMSWFSDTPSWSLM